MLRPITPVISYYINYDYIVAELCENKAKPVLQCNGKCHLAKELKKANDGLDTEQSAPPLNMKDYPIVPIFTNNIVITTPRFFIKKTTPNMYFNSFENTYCNFIFQPPKHNC